MGPATDSQARGSPGEDKTYQQFHRVVGGVLSIELTSAATQSQIAFQLRHVDGEVVDEAKLLCAVK